MRNIQSRKCSIPIFIQTFAGKYLDKRENIIPQKSFCQNIYLCSLNMLHSYIWLQSQDAVWKSRYGTKSRENCFFLLLLLLLLLSRFSVSDSMRPHRQQPTKLRHPWVSRGKSTGVGCHCFFLARHMISKSRHYTSLEWRFLYVYGRGLLSSRPCLTHPRRSTLICHTSLTTSWT